MTTGTNIEKLNYRVSEAAKLLSLSEDAVRKLVDAGIIAHIRTGLHGRSIRIHVDEIKRYAKVGIK